MGKKLIVEFLHDWLTTEKLRHDVLHKESDGMQDFGLDASQSLLLRQFERPEIAKKMCEELGIDLEELKEAVYGSTGEVPAGAAAAYDQGRTHIRRVIPSVISANTQSEVVLMGHGFKSNTNLVTVEFRTGPPPNPTKVQGQVTEIKSDIDVWQRVTVSVTVTDSGDWDVLAHNDDDKDGAGNFIWSEPSGTIHAV